MGMSDMAYLSPEWNYFRFTEAEAFSNLQVSPGYLSRSVKRQSGAESAE